VRNNLLSSAATSSSLSATHFEAALREEFNALWKMPNQSLPIPKANRPRLNAVHHIQQLEF
jgi:hypothetical protein